MSEKLHVNGKIEHVVTYKGNKCDFDRQQPACAKEISATRTSLRCYAQ